MNSMDEIDDHEERGDPIMEDIRPLTPGLWIGQSQFFYTNAGIFASGDVACLVDPCMMPAEMGRIRAFLKEHNLAAQMLVLTHFHWDHILGPESFPEAQVIAHRQLPEVLAGTAGESTLAEIKRWEAHCQIERACPFEIPQVDRLVDPPEQLVLGDRVFDLIHTPGHSPDQLSLYEPQTATLWAADILSDVEIPFISDSLSAFEDTLARLAQLEIQVLVPGHGFPSHDPAAIRQRIETDRDYLATLRARVEEALATGKSMAETVACCAGMVYRNPAQNADPHQRNVESVYAELGGDVDPGRIGWNRPPTEEAF